MAHKWKYSLLPPPRYLSENNSKGKHLPKRLQYPQWWPISFKKRPFFCPLLGYYFQVFVICSLIDPSAVEDAVILRMSIIINGRESLHQKSGLAAGRSSVWARGWGCHFQDLFGGLSPHSSCRALLSPFLDSPRFGSASQCRWCVSVRPFGALYTKKSNDKAK